MKQYAGVITLAGLNDLMRIYDLIADRSGSRKLCGSMWKGCERTARRLNTLRSVGSAKGLHADDLFGELTVGFWPSLC